MKQIKPQKARGKIDDAKWDSLDWIAEEKFDGDRRIAQFEERFIRFTGTRESVDGTGFVEKSAQIPQLSGLSTVGVFKLPDIRKLYGTVLDGEIVPPFGKKIKGGRSKYVTSIMGSAPDEAVRKQRVGGFLCYVVFDCLWYRGRDVRGYPLRERYNFRDQTLREWGNTYASCAAPVVGESKRAFFDLVVGRGGEGVVLKHFDHHYGDERLWVKVKAEATADVVILDFTEGKGKYKGQIGAIVFAQVAGNGYLVEVGQCSGMDDTTRLMLSSGGRPRWKDRVIEIMHNGREPTGAFRHPRFKRFRPDKSPKDCIYDPEET